MNRNEFMKRLEELLADISEDEREEALQYYEDYFDDAGVEKEAEIIEELVSPEQVARKIQAGLSGDDGEFSEEGYRDSRFEGWRQMPETRTDADRKAAGKMPRKPANLWKLLAIVLLCILLAPIVIPVGFAALVGIIGVLLAVLVTAAGIGISGVVMIAGGIVAFGYGVVCMFGSPAGGILMLGAGCLLAAVGILVSLLILWLCRRVVPVLIQGAVNLISYPFRKAGAVK